MEGELGAEIDLSVTMHNQITIGHSTCNRGGGGGDGCMHPGSDARRQDP